MGRRSKVYIYIHIFYIYMYYNGAIFFDSPKRWDSSGGRLKIQAFRMYDIWMDAFTFQDSIVESEGLL